MPQTPDRYHRACTCELLRDGIGSAWRRSAWRRSDRNRRPRSCAGAGPRRDPVRVGGAGRRAGQHVPFAGR